MRWYLGADPGPSTGVALAGTNGVRWECHAYQCDGAVAPQLVGWLCAIYEPLWCETERFLTGNTAGTKGGDADLTRAIEHEIRQSAITHPGIKLITRPAGAVKRWATNKRLEKVSFPLGPKFLDARDAGRHALYTAVWDGKERDPLA